ncbi:MAG TPA: hypothetical protein VGB73_04095 [Pyrinomonadaceae bacterium]|jgi:uncharacterized membrane-anchored protein
MRIIVFIVNASIQLLGSALGFFMLLMGLNGFNEKEAMPGLIFYVIASCMGATLLGGVSAAVAKLLVDKKAVGSLAASAIAIPLFLIIGVGLWLVIFIASTLVVSFVHDWK